MTTYEEDMVDVFFNLNGFFTIKNIPFPHEEKKPGGRGRGEIDILAIKPEKSVFKFARAEVSVSLTSPFPFKSSIDRVNIDDTFRLVMKFFSKSAEIKIKEYTKGRDYDCIFVSSSFEKNSLQKLKDRAYELEKKGIWKDKLGLTMKFFNPSRRGEIIIIDAKFNDTQKKIEVISFSNTINSMEKTFIYKKLLLRNFQDSRLRGIQHLIYENLKNFAIRNIVKIDTSHSPREINKIVLNKFEEKFGLRIKDHDRVKELKHIIKDARFSIGR